MARLRPVLVHNGIVLFYDGGGGPMPNETSVQQRTRVEHCQATHGQIWRNNVGAGRVVGDDGVERMIRWGLANDSAQVNKEIKSSDLIGITPVLITPAMVGFSLGVFTAYEVKAPGWRLTPGDQRGLAQQRFHDIVRAACGFAGFVTDPRDIYRIIGRE